MAFLWNRVPSRASFALALSLALASTATAVTTYQVTIVNNTGGPVDDVHLIFTNTGNSVANRLVLAPAGGVVQASPGNGFNAAFVPSLANAGTFIGQFDANFPNVAFASGVWTRNGATDVIIEPREVKLQAVPEPTTCLALAAGMGVLLRRRKARV